MNIVASSIIIIASKYVTYADLVNFVVTFCIYCANFYKTSSTEIKLFRAK